MGGAIFWASPQTARWIGLRLPAAHRSHSSNGTIIAAPTTKSNKKRGVSALLVGQSRSESYLRLRYILITRAVKVDLLPDGLLKRHRDRRFQSSGWIQIRTIAHPWVRRNFRCSPSWTGMAIAFALFGELTLILGPLQSPIRIPEAEPPGPEQEESRGAQGNPIGALQPNKQTLPCDVWWTLFRILHQQPHLC